MSRVVNVFVRCVQCCVQCLLKACLVDQLVLRSCVNFDIVIHRFLLVVNMSITYPIAKLKRYSSLQFVEKSAVIGKIIKRADEWTSPTVRELVSVY